MHFQNLCVIQEQKGALKNCGNLVKTIVAVHLIFYKLICFEVLIIFVETAIKLIIGIFDS